MEVMIDNMLCAFRKKDNLDVLQRKLSRSSLSSSTSTLYSDDEQYLKVFDNDKKLSNKLFKAERDTYKKLAKIKKLAPYVPKIIDSNESKDRSYLLMENRGNDGITMINTPTLKFTHTLWKKLLIDVSTALKIMHENGISHGDMKPENIAYDEKTNIWSIIDFGFSQKDKFGLGGFIGTIPYCSPHLGNHIMNVHTRVNSPSLDSEAVGDIYSFALSALSLYGYFFTIDTVPHVSLDIKKLIQLYNKNTEESLTKAFIPFESQFDEWTKEVLHLLAGMVLTQMDTSAEKAIWVKKGCYCHFVGNNTIPFQLEHTDINEYWKKFDVLVNVL
jgi:serine/threonine protein kinase